MIPPIASSPYVLDSDTTSSVYPVGQAMPQPGATIGEPPRALAEGLDMSESDPIIPPDGTGESKPPIPADGNGESEEADSDGIPRFTILLLVTLAYRRLLPPTPWSHHQQAYHGMIDLIYILESPFGSDGILDVASAIYAFLIVLTFIPRMKSTFNNWLSEDDAPFSMYLRSNAVLFLLFTVLLTDFLLFVRGLLNETRIASHNEPMLLGTLLFPIAMIVLVAHLMRIEIGRYRSSSERTDATAAAEFEIDWSRTEPVGFVVSLGAAFILHQIILFMIHDQFMLDYTGYYDRFIVEFIAPIVHAVLLIIAAVHLRGTLDDERSTFSLDRRRRVECFGEFSRSKYSTVVVLLLSASFIAGVEVSGISTMLYGYSFAAQPEWSGAVIISSLLVLLSLILFIGRRLEVHRGSMDPDPTNGRDFQSIKSTSAGILVHLMLFLIFFSSSSSLEKAFDSFSFYRVVAFEAILFVVCVGALLRQRSHWNERIEEGDSTMDPTVHARVIATASLLTLVILVIAVNSLTADSRQTSIAAGVPQFTILAYYSLLIIATMEIRPLLSWQESEDPTVDVDQIMFEVRKLNEAGVKHYSGEEFEEAKSTFESSHALVLRALGATNVEEGSDVAATLSSFKDYIETNLENAALGIAGSEIQSAMTALDERVTAIQTNVHDNPVEAKRTARSIEDEVTALHSRAEEHGFKTVGQFCLTMLDRVREVAATADRILMGAVSQTAPVAAPSLAATPSMIQPNPAAIHAPASEPRTPTPQADAAAMDPSAGLEPQPILSAPTDVSARFTVGELIAVGGMANVFLATEIATARKVIWKQAHGQFNPLAISNKKLADEVELLQVARHARIPDYLAHGEVVNEKEGGQYSSVLIEEYIPGGDLKNTVEQISKVGASISLTKIIEYLVAISEPLEHMAELAEPVYHRDLKPHNVIVHPERGPVLIDFGLAKMVATGEDVSITRGGSGTWTAPERDAGVSGPFTDVYSLGKILFFLLTNQQPPAILTTQKLEPVTDVGHPEWISDLCLRAAWPDRTERIQTVREFRIMLENDGYWPEGVPHTIESEGSDDYTTWG